MLRCFRSRVIRFGVARHPVVRAWLAMAPGQPLPRRLRRIRERRKSAVYRLEKLNGRGTVIGKRSRLQPGRYEEFLYREILPQQPASFLHFYGAVEEPGSEYRWLFMEDAGVKRYTPHTPGYPGLGVHWLAGLHTATAWREPPPGLAERGPAYYLQERLLPAAAEMTRCLENPVLDHDQRGNVHQILAQMERIERRWPELTAFCRQMPQTLVHGDFVEKNIGLKKEGSQQRLLPFDWETAGCGVPAPDISLCGDVEGYWRAVSPAWPHLTLGDVRQMALIGELFRLLASLHWRSPNLLTSWAHRDSATLIHYRTRLDRVICDLGWN